MALARGAVAENGELNRRSVDAFELQPRISFCAFAAHVGQRVGVASLKIGSDGLALGRAHYLYETPWLTVSDRRRKLDEIEQLVDQSLRNRNRAKPSDVAPPFYQSPQLLAEIFVKYWGVVHGASAVTWKKEPMTSPHCSPDDARPPPVGLRVEALGASSPKWGRRPRELMRRLATLVPAVQGPRADRQSRGWQRWPARRSSPACSCRRGRSATDGAG